MRKQPERLSTVHIRRYALYLREQERAPATIQKYLHDLHVFLEYLDGRPLTKAVLIGGKEELTANHAPASVNSMLAAVGGFLRFMGWEELRVKPLKIQRSPFCDGTGTDPCRVCPAGRIQRCPGRHGDSGIRGL